MCQPLGVYKVIWFRGRPAHWTVIAWVANIFIYLKKRGKGDIQDGQIGDCRSSQATKTISPSMFCWIFSAPTMTCMAPAWRRSISRRDPPFRKFESLSDDAHRLFSRIHMNSHPFAIVPNNTSLDETEWPWADRWILLVHLS